MHLGDILALSGLFLGIFSALAAFIYWLVTVSYKITRFIFDLRSDLNEIKQTMHESKYAIASLERRVQYLQQIVRREFPHYFKREEDSETNYQESQQT